jgi:hypothetical protein
MLIGLLTAQTNGFFRRWVGNAIGSRRSKQGIEGDLSRGEKNESHLTWHAENTRLSQVASETLKVKLLRPNQIQVKSSLNLE